MDVECPYCEKWNDICHDDGFGYAEDTNHQMDCEHCGKTFVFTTSISYYYEAAKADCLNDGEHNYQFTRTYPKEFSEMRCWDCGCKRPLTEEERIKFDVGKIEDYLNRLK